MNNQPRGLTAVLTAVAVIGAACGGLRDGDGPFDPPEEPVLWMYAQAPIAVGARLELVAYLSCPKSVGNSEGSACQKTGIASVTSVSLDDPAGLSPGEVRLEPLSSSSEDLFAAYIPVTASARADTTLRVTVKDTRGQTLSTEVPVSARVANRVTLSPRCDNPTASAPYLIGKGKIVWFDYGLFNEVLRPRDRRRSLRSPPALSRSGARRAPSPSCACLTPGGQPPSRPRSTRHCRSRSRSSIRVPR